MNSNEVVMIRKAILILVFAVISMFVFGCAGTTPKQDQYSGYLKNYSQLQQEKDPKGDVVLRFISPRFSPQKYKKVIIEPVQYYPEPQPSEHVTADTLKQIKDYVDQALRFKVGKKLQVVEQSGADTLRLRVALTAVEKSNEGLQPYQYVPVALVITGARAAAGAHPEQAAIFLEAEMTDSISGERLAIAVRGGTGERLTKLKGSGSIVTLDTVKPLLDRWSNAYAEYLFESK
jgi:hypothetical protein